VSNWKCIFTLMMIIRYSFECCVRMSLYTLVTVADRPFIIASKADVFSADFVVVLFV